MIAPQNLPVKICPAQAAAGRGGSLPVNCRPKEDFSGRRSYNGAPPAVLRSSCEAVAPQNETVCFWSMRP